jgi:DNA-binding NarL/FixJ family response regulator
MVWPTLSPELRERVEQIRASRVEENRRSPQHGNAGRRASSRGLSARERQVLEGVAAGDSNAEIAAVLHVAPLTVQSHVQHILRALPARNRTHAVTVAFRQGLLTLDD